ncbi:hypothetical protein ACQ4PT_064477 [Festuca glaucescens]
MTSCTTKRRRSAAATSDAAMAAPSSLSPWASILPGDLLRLIAWRVLEGDFLDYVRFRAVCTGWRSGTLCPRGRGVTDLRFHPRRWMMLTEGHGLYPGHGKLGGYVRFFNLYTGTFVRLKLPLFRNHCALDSVDGLLILQRDEDTTIHVLHPFTGDIAELPPLASLLNQLGGDLNGARSPYIPAVGNAVMPPSSRSLLVPRKRRRSVVETSDAAMAAPSSPSPWASFLPGDLLRLIAWLILDGDFLDYVRFRAVYTSWRSGTICPGGRGITDLRFHPRGWMMLTEGHGYYPGHGKLGGYVRFFNLYSGTFVRVKLPLFRNHCVDGLLLLQRDDDTVIRVLHPFTGDIAELSPLSTLLTQLDDDRNEEPECEKWFFIRYNICASVSCNAGITSVMLASHYQSRVAFATSQDRHWTVTSWKVPRSVRPLSFRGKLYVVHNQTPAIDATSTVLQIDHPLQDQIGLGSREPSPPKLVATCPPDILRYPLYLVECDSEILVVGHSDSSFSHILVYKLADLMLGRFIPITSIGDRALFIEERSLSVSSKSLPTIMAETVVYIHPRTHDFAQFQLRTGIWSRPIDELGLDGFAPGPCSLIHHVLSCCIRNVWYITSYSQGSLQILFTLPGNSFIPRS